MPIMSHADWMSRTALFAKPRSKEIKVLDAAIQDYGKSPGNQDKFDQVVYAYQAWAATKKNADASERNKRGAITDLFAQIIDFRDKNMPHRHQGETIRPDDLMAAIRKGAKLFGEGKLKPAINVKIDGGDKDPMFGHVRYENMDAAVLQRAISCMADMQRYSRAAAMGIGQLVNNKAEAARYQRWFGETSPSRVMAVTRGLRALHSAVQHSPQTYVLRKNILNHYVNGDYPFSPMEDGKSTENVYGYVWGHQAGSGYRVVLCNQFVNDPDRSEATQTMYHELTHKVIKTVDHVYGRPGCLDLAKKSPGQAIENADNWGYYLISFGGVHK